VRFAFTDEQLAFRDALRELLARGCPPAVVRKAWENESGRTESVWARLADMGVLGVLAAESAGGLGGDEVDCVLLLEESGYAALPEPLVEHALVATPLLGERAEAAASGAITVTAQCSHEPIAVAAPSADLIVLERDERFFAVESTDVRLTPISSVDGSRRLARVDWDPAEATALGGADEAALAFDRGVLGTAAQLVGLARRMLDMTVEYAKDRVQFGVPIGSFQAVKHHLADARIAVEFARPLVYHAAWSVAQAEPGRGVQVSAAKSAAGDAALLAARKALQCHGAIGYSFEHDLHLFMKRAWALAATWGTGAWHRDRVARAILTP
jgi:alkylation response protein AidB-like acyl-CoA dehydrogenase